MKAFRLQNTLAIALMLVLLSSCMVTSGIKNTSSIIAPGANTKLYRTYSWYQPNPAAPASFDKGYKGELNERIVKAVETELQEKGYKKVTENPDVLLAYDLSVSVPVEKDAPGTYPNGFGYSYAYMSGYRYNYGNAGLPGYRAVDLFKSGTLIIDFISPKTNQLVWRGWTEGAFDDFSAGNGKVQQEVEEILNKL
ncbi:DUF4136 domain-containing protein [Pontibacter cellulosilyticus]|uniref:DUF4136 domain-containing protein n=1 Tax=Pontibacter cellulosilyticus TaxID=1720253 RepID=A0A923N507_9BACT|nr:DUF4136 domain-containing protein [Pontibacter cellulosilyticus]MBC5991591.1 DUF4136 domain-containing protein [Pontibacter cellulosilyticus]